MKTVEMFPGGKEFLEQEELTKTQEMHNEFNKLKAHLADVSLQKHGILKQIDMLRDSFAAYENGLISKYGVDAIINVQTGEITRKQKDG
jgi:hypothetical protein